MTTDLPAPEAPVLSTLHEDGSRRWMRPKLSRGRFLRVRRMLAYLLIDESKHEKLLASLAEVATTRDYVRPELTLDRTLELQLNSSRSENVTGAFHLECDALFQVEVLAKFKAPG